MKLKVCPKSTPCYKVNKVCGTLYVYSYEADPPNGVYVDPQNGAMLTIQIISY